MGCFFPISQISVLQRKQSRADLAFWAYYILFVFDKEQAETQLIRVGKLRLGITGTEIRETQEKEAEKPVVL